jgi:hypothetical protein
MLTQETAEELLDVRGAKVLNIEIAHSPDEPSRNKGLLLDGGGRASRSTAREVLLDGLAKSDVSAGHLVLSLCRRS